VADEPSFEEKIRRPIVLAHPGMDAVSCHRDLVYRSADGVSLPMDAYPAAAPGGGFVLLVHGGPLGPEHSPKDWGLFTSTARSLAAEGLTAFAFNHRFHGASTLLQAADDVRAALAFARSQAFGFDPDRAALVAYSGGGIFLSPFLEDPPPFVRALVGFYPALDLREAPPGAEDTLGPELRARFSPAARVSAAAPPILVARAGLDHPLLNAGIDRFAASALEKNAPLLLVNHPQGHHGFDVADPDARSREILALAFRFLKTHLGA
jgi:dienelactone hydrolase